MATSRRVKVRRGGRATPRGTKPGTASGRYTPPIPREEKISPTWVPVLMFACLIVGMGVIILNYLGIFGGDANNAYLLGGLGLITVGFITATRLH
jgi:hypothetical protein